jgi:hypothetical protein
MRAPHSPHFIKLIAFTTAPHFKHRSGWLHLGHFSAPAVTNDLHFGQRSGSPHLAQTNMFGAMAAPHFGHFSGAPHSTQMRQSGDSAIFPQFGQRSGVNGCCAPQ